MVATSTAVNACDAVIQLDGPLSSLVDISGSSNAVDLKFEQDIADFKVFGSNWKIRLACGKDASIKLEVVYTTSSTEARSILEAWWAAGGARTIQIDVPSSSTGNRRYSGEVFLKGFSFPIKSDEAGPVMMSAELLPTGEFAIAAIA